MHFWNCAAGGTFSQLEKAVGTGDLSVMGGAILHSVSFFLMSENAFGLGISGVC
jgi:hypothetical protein